MRARVKPIDVLVATGFVDNRSEPNQVPIGGYRHALNWEVRSKNKICRKTGFAKLLDGPNFNNADLHDPLFGNGVLPIRRIFAAENEQGFSKLFVANERRVYALNTDSGNWKLIWSAAKATPRIAQLGDFVVLTDGQSPVQYHIVDQASEVDGDSVVPIQDLLDLNITRAGTCFVWNDLMFLANLLEDGEFATNAIIWSDYKRPTSFKPRAGTSLAGRKTLDSGEIVLAALPVNNVLLIYTDRSIWQVDVSSAGELTFRKRYEGNRPGDRCLAFPNTLVAVGASHFYVSQDGIYRYDLYLPEPERVEWLHRATARIFEDIDLSDCQSHNAGYDVTRKAIHFSWKKRGEDVPSETLLINTEYPWANFLDYGMTAAGNFSADRIKSLRSWVLENCICTIDELQDDPILGFGQEGQFCVVLDPTLCESRPDCFFSTVEVTEDGITHEDFDAQPGPNSLFNRLGDVSIEELCAGELLADACDAEEIFVIALASDNCLKQSADVFYREVCTDRTLCGTFEKTGYRSLLRSAAMPIAAPLVFFTLDASPEVQAVPSKVILRIGSSQDGSDPNGPDCQIMWEDQPAYDLKCLAQKTAAQHKADGTFPDKDFAWSLFHHGGDYKYFEVEIFNSVAIPPDTGGACCVGGFHLAYQN